MTTNECATCGRAILDTAYVDSICADRTAKRLREAAELYTEIAVAVARLVRFGTPIGRGGNEQPIPFNPAASADHASVLNAWTTWARHIEEQSGRQAPTDPVKLAHWLAEQVDWLRYRAEAAEALDELEDAAALVIRIVDAPPPRAYLGRCGHDGCTGDLYALPGRVARCRDCGTEHDPDLRRQWLMREAADQTGTAADMARYASALIGDMVTSASVRGLAFRGRITAIGVDLRERPVYRVGDVIAAMGAAT